MLSNATEIVRLIELLRADEGDSVTLLCDNPDFNGQPNCAVVCNGDWTSWVDRRFAADTILDALSMAATEKALPSPRKVIATSNGHHWVERFNLVCCRDCGFVRRADDTNAPCRGCVGVGIRRDLSPAEQDAFAWLIEKGPFSEPDYYAPTEPGEWTKNHLKACRFLRKEDAEAVQFRHVTHGHLPERGTRVCEHGWHSPRRETA